MPGRCMVPLPLRSESNKERTIRYGGGVIAFRSQQTLFHFRNKQEICWSNGPPLSAVGRSDAMSHAWDMARMQGRFHITYVYIVNVAIYAFIMMPVWSHRMIATALTPTAEAVTLWPFREGLLILNVYWGRGGGSIRHTSGISGGFRQLRIYVSAVMADFETFVMRPKEDTARDKLIPRKLVRQSRGDTKEEDVICYHSAHCRQILSIKTPLSSPSNSRIIWHVVAVACVKHTRIVYVCVTSDRTIFQYGDLTFTAETWCRSVEGGPSGGGSRHVWESLQHRPI